MALKVNFKDDILNASMNTKRKYNLVYNNDGTVSLQDATVYTQTGDLFGAAEINSTNDAINTLSTDVTALKKYTVYNKFSDINGSAAGLLMRTYIERMADNSYLNTFINQTGTTYNVADVMPSNYGILEITKVQSGMAYIKFTVSGGTANLTPVKIYYANYGATNNAVGGWYLLNVTTV